MIDGVTKPTFIETHKLNLTLTVRENLSPSQLYKDIFSGKQIPKLVKLSTLSINKANK